MGKNRSESGELGDAHVGGQGSTLVLLHGLTGTWHIWKPVLSLLEQHHRVVAITLPGHSGGPRLPAGAEATVANLADEVIAELARRGITSAHVAGNSIGGWLALELARRGFARSVTALSPAGGWRTAADYRDVSKPFRMAYYAMPLILLLTALFLWLGALRHKLLAQTMEAGERIPPMELFVSLIAFLKTVVLLPLLRNMGRDGPITALDAGSTPIRIAWSGSDRVIPFDRYGKLMVERVARAELLTLPGVGHVPMYDDPEGVAACILAVTLAVDAHEAAEPKPALATGMPTS